MSDVQDGDQLYCDECDGLVLIVDMVTAFQDRGYWWCAKHAKVHHWEMGIPTVDFPSPGQLAPLTICHD